jgi:hypothetical protein
MIENENESRSSGAARMLRFAVPAVLIVVLAGCAGPQAEGRPDLADAPFPNLADVPPVPATSTAEERRLTLENLTRDREAAVAAGAAHTAR